MDALPAHLRLALSVTAYVLAYGAGIGLFVCRQLIEAMGGRTWLRSRHDAGTEAGFALPLTIVGTDDGSSRAG